ncbi:hypothetical protein [Alicyclobacillus fastidiosus]|uniref:ATP-binding protein n=1 Tax=Alicyclobacillus fastidiosus TaxID=392011 RepID=A0ABV5AL45_9BACL
MDVIRITPDRSARNVQGNVFANALHDCHSIVWARLKLGWKGIKHTEPVRFWHIIDMSLEGIKFYMAAPNGEFSTYASHRLSRYWPKATIEAAQEIPAIEHGNTDVVELNLTKHNIFGLGIGRDEDTTPIADILSVLEDFREGDRAVIAYCFEPYDRVSWADIADNAYELLKAGKVPKRFELKLKVNPMKAAELLNDQLYGAYDTLFGALDGKAEAKKKDAERNKKPQKSAERVTITQQNEFSAVTRNKRSQPVFKAWMRVLVTSKDSARRKVLTRAFSNAYAALNGDNSLKGERGSRSAIDEVNTLQLHQRTVLAPGVNILSSTEVGKLIQIPTASLQDEYKDYIESINKRELDLPEWLTSGGIELGEVTYKGKTETVYVQTKDHDTLCLPWFSFGPQSVGKTGQGVKTAVEFIRAGYSAFVIDVADGDLVTEARDAMPEWMPDDHIIDMDLGHKDFAIPMNWSERAATGDPDDEADVANLMAAQLVRFIDTIAKSETSDRMSMYLKDAGRARLGRSGATPLDAMLMLTSKKYWTTHKRYVSSPRVKAKLEAFWSQSDRERNEIIRPIQNRISLLMDEERVADHTLQPDKTDDDGNPLINFRKWADGDVHPYFVGIRIPKDFFLDAGTDAVATFVISKLWLAILSRYDTPKKDRRPCVFVMDEPHQFPSALPLYKGVVRESRKWRLKLMWLGHTLEDFKEIIEQVRAAGCQYSQYKAKSEASLKMILPEMAPFTKEELINIPDRYWAVNRITAPGMEEPAPAFLAHMAAPPKAVKDRSYLRDYWAKTLGRPRKEVRKALMDKEAQYL